jgi:hypothetical protein
MVRIDPFNDFEVNEKRRKEYLRGARFLFTVRQT